MAIIQSGQSAPNKGSQILVATGTDGDYSQVVDLQSTKKCSNLPSYPVLLSGATGGLINGSPLICGGYGRPRGESHLSDDDQPSCYMYDKTSQTWNWHSNTETKRYASASALVKGTLWVTGGSPDVASTEFIHGNGTITTGPSLPTARSSHCMITLHDKRVMILGGFSNSNLKSVVIFNPADESFTNGPTLLYKRYHAACTLFLSALHDNRPVVLVAGGSDQATAELFDYTNGDAWEEIESLPWTDDLIGLDFYGARALPSLAGNGAILQHAEKLYELKCSTSSCNWKILWQTLIKPVSGAVMMYLPPGHSC